MLQRVHYKKKEKPLETMNLLNNLIMRKQQSPKTKKKITPLAKPRTEKPLKKPKKPTPKKNVTPLNSSVVDSDETTASFVTSVKKGAKNAKKTGKPATRKAGANKKTTVKKAPAKKTTKKTAKGAAKTKKPTLPKKKASPKTKPAAKNKKR